MERVNFFYNKALYEKAEEIFLINKALIEELIPEADVQHVGSTSISKSITKGDLDIQVRVNANIFPYAVKELAKLYKLNGGSVKTETFRAFKDDSAVPPVGVQLTVINSEFDFFWKFRDVLQMNDNYRKEYDNLKRKYEGMKMEDYREAKNKFFEKMIASPEYKNI